MYAIHYMYYIYMHIKTYIQIIIIYMYYIYIYVNIICQIIINLIKLYSNQLYQLYQIILKYSYSSFIILKIFVCVAYLFICTYV